MAEEEILYALERQNELLEEQNRLLQHAVDALEDRVIQEAHANELNLVNYNGQWRAEPPNQN